MVELDKLHLRSTMNFIFLSIVLSAVAPALYLPGTAPKEYNDGEIVAMQANVLSAIRTHLPFDYYSLPVCHPRNPSRGSVQNLGEVLLGNRRKPAPYELRMNTNVKCAVVCGPLPVSTSAAQSLRERIRDEYSFNFILDNLPLAMINPATNTFSVGVPLGEMQNNEAFVHNHLHFTIKYYELTENEIYQQVTSKEEFKSTSAPSATEDDDEEKAKRIIAFIAKPLSLSHDPTAPMRRCNDANFSFDDFQPHPASSSHIVWSYAVTWERSDEVWTTRWDVYLNVEDHEIHWFSIINSTLIVLFLTAMVAVIIMRAVRRDIVKYNAILDPEELLDESGWKAIHRDVFRPPSHGNFLAALVGTGTQLLLMALVVVAVACLGFLAPANRGALFTTLLVCYVLLGATAGYVASRFLRLWGIPSWKSVLLTATIVPGIAFSVFFLLNLAVWSTGSSGAVPFVTMLAIVSMWFFISMPLVFVGAIIGYKTDILRIPVAINQVPRHISEVPWHMRPLSTIAIGGILPFGAVFIETYFILSAVWLNRYYYVFGFLLLVILILLITCAEMTIVMTYFQLCAEDYRWWWRAFCTSGSCGLYLFLYAIFYFFSAAMGMTRFVSLLLYFGYMGLVSFVFAVMTGAAGFLAAFVFVRYLYSSVKVD